MRAILFATGGRDGATPWIERYPDPLLPLLDRPFLQHVIEYLARQGVRRFDIVLSHKPEMVESYFGDGTRWGCRFTYHLARDPKRPYRVLDAIERAPEDGPILLGHADRLPAFAIEAIVDRTESPLPLVTEDDSGAIAWTGWALIPAEMLGQIPTDRDEQFLARHLLAYRDDYPVDQLLSAGSLAGLLASQRAVLEKEFQPLFLTGREVEPGIWLSRNVSLHPGAKVTAPVFIGEDCRIGPGARVGPHAVIGRGCVLGSDCTITRSLVFPENYIGDDLVLDDIVVDRNRILSSAGTDTEADALLLGSLSPGQDARWSGLAGRLLALILLVPAAPILLVTALVLKLTRPGPVVHGMRSVILPAADTKRRRSCTLWSFDPAGPRALAEGRMPFGVRSLLLVVLPALMNIARGELRFAGVAPRPPEEVDQLPREWRTLYLCCKAGLITEASGRPSAAASEEERYAAEAYYAAAADWRYDIRLTCRWIFGTLLATATAVG